MGITYADGTKEEGGWTASDTGSLYAVIRVDENNNQIGEADAVFEIEDIPKAIRKMMEVDYNANNI